MSYNANQDNGNQDTDRGLKEAFQSVQNSFSSEGDYNGVKVLGGLAGVAAVGGLGYVGYNQWLQHQGKDDNPQAAEEFKQQAKPVAVDPQNKTATVVNDQNAYGAAAGGYGAQGGYGSNQTQGGYGGQQQQNGYGGQGGYGDQNNSYGQQQQQQQPQEDHSTRNTALKVLGGLAGVASIGGLGYVGYKQWIEHKNKEDSPQAAEEFKQEAKPVEVNPQTQTVQVAGDNNANISNQYQQAIAAGGYTGNQVNANGGTGCQGVQWQVQYGDKPYPSNAIRGGQESDGQPLYIARTKHTDGTVQPGKAGPTTGGGCLYAWGGRELYSSVYEVLVGDQNSVKWVDVQGTPQPNGWTPIEAGKDSDGSVLWIAKANYEGSQQIGKAGPALGEGLVGWGGQQRKVQQYQVLARA
ncbi:hypothetical protein HK097_002993 [Rhizophlyctis rosea]|uniref:Uncharacterized protein n=1 Tax=Rhizophlyctis rosea TaxID=64517 RepID=A0AAD5S4Q8_9FUNG|nr:hypothetical protein HK097_002993 [Rhizophlyctis rosea]